MHMCLCICSEVHKAFMCACLHRFQESVGIIGCGQYIGHWFYSFVDFGLLSNVPFNSCDHVETVS